MPSPNHFRLIAAAACQRLSRIGKSFRTPESDLQVRPVYQRKRDLIEVHLTIVFAAHAISRWIEDRKGKPTGPGVVLLGARLSRSLPERQGRLAAPLRDPMSHR